MGRLAPISRYNRELTGHFRTFEFRSITATHLNHRLRLNKQAGRAFLPRMASPKRKRSRVLICGINRT